MSLVGSLEDLGLGDILQIVSLSRKSGLLLIHSEEGEGRILFYDGLVRAAFVKGEPEDLHGLLVVTGFVPEAEFERAKDLAQARQEPLDTIIPECTTLTRERLDSLRREHVERAVFRIFSWRGGEFSFEVRDEIDARDAEILLPTGVNAQYLTMEATRIGDEDDRSPEPAREGAERLAPVADSEDAPMFSGEVAPEATPASPEPALAEDEDGETAGALADAPLEAHQVVALAAVRESEELDAAPIVDAELETPGASSEAVALPSDRDQEEPARASAEAAENTAEPAPADTAEPAGPVDPMVLIAIDPRLNTLEWQKSILRELFSRVHIFQRMESGLARIRQYLGRGEAPVVLVSADFCEDGDIDDAELADFVRRLKLQAPAMPVFVALGEDSESPAAVAAADAAVRRPVAAALATRRTWPRLEAEAESFREAMRNWRVAVGLRAGSNGSRGAKRSVDDPSEGLRRLREMSRRVRDPAIRGEVLSLVLEFASEVFSRVAIFMVREEVAVGMAQLGLEKAGGPDDEALRAIELPAREVASFRSVLETGASIRCAPTDATDRELATQLGSGVPAEIYIAPIESGGRVVALLYADHLPAARAIGDTTILEIVLHEAGLALERALLERTWTRGERP